MSDKIFSDRIIRCPYCGGEAFAENYDPSYGYASRSSYGRVTCSECGARVKDETVEKAIEKWNRRKTSYSFVFGGAISIGDCFNIDGNMWCVDGVYKGEDKHSRLVLYQIKRCAEDDES